MRLPRGSTSPRGGRSTGPDPLVAQAWEDDPAARGSRWRALALLLLAVVVGAYLVRPSGLAGLDGLPGLIEEDGLAVVPEPPRSGEEASEQPPTATATVHALSTARLGVRVPPVEIPLGGRRLRSAVSSRGRQLLALGLEDPASGNSRVQVRHASGLQLIDELGPLDGPLEHLGVSEDGLAVVWAQPASGGRGPRLHRAAIDGPVTTFPLPRSVAVVGLRGLRDERVAGVLRDADAPEGTLRVIVHQGVGEPVVDATVDVGERAPSGMAHLPVGPEAGLVWDDALLLLHLVHAAEDGLTTIDLRSGEVIAAPPELDRGGAGAIRREAVLLPDGDAVAATGTLTRPDPDPARDGTNTVPLEPLILDAGYEADQRGIVRGAAAPWRALAAGPSRVVLAAPSWRPQSGDRATRIRVFDRTFTPVWSYLMEGEVSAAEINYRETHLIVVRETARVTLVSELPLGPGDVIHRSFAPGSVVHPTAVVVIEQRAGQRP